MTWQYIAGFFDGEGSIGLAIAVGRTGLLRPRPSMHQSGLVGKQVLTEIRDFLAKYGIRSSLRPQLKGGGRLGKRPMFALRVSQAHASEFLSRVLPYIHIKKVLAQDILRFRIIFPKSEKNRRFLISEAKRRRAKLRSVLTV